MEFLYSYGLFAAKLFTILAFIMIIIAFLVSVASNRSQQSESIEIEKLNDKYESIQETLQEEILDKEQLKAIQKEKKKKEKENNSEEEEKHKIFVIRFDGDIQATEADNLAQNISAILSVANETDEILLVMESSGGMVHNYGYASSQLQRIKNRNIQLTIAVDLVAASGGYMMACVADKIIAAPFAIVGSIGVCTQPLLNFNKILKQHNVDIEQHTAGKYKTTLTMLGENTQESREKFISELEDTHDLFKSFVKTNRPALDVDKIATGEHWYAAQTLELGLVDEIMNSEDYINSKILDNHEVYEIKYVINMSLKDKIHNIIEGSMSKALQLLNRKFFV